MSATFIPFPQGAIPGGYLTGVLEELAVLVLWHPAHSVWEVQYPSPGIEIYCSQAKDGSWHLAATTPDVGAASGVPLICAVYSPLTGMEVTYSYSYPETYLNTDAHEQLSREINRATACLKLMCQEVIGADSPPVGQPLQPGLVTATFGGQDADGWQSIWHLLDSSGALYTFLDPVFDGERQTLRGPVFKSGGKLPATFLTISISQGDFTAAEAFGTLTAKGAAACQLIAEAVLQTAKS